MCGFNPLDMLVCFGPWSVQTLSMRCLDWLVAWLSSQQHALCSWGAILDIQLSVWNLLYDSVEDHEEPSWISSCQFETCDLARIRAGWSCFGKNKEILKDKQLPISLKKQVIDQCILPTMTYGCQTWSLNKQMTNKLRTAQRAMERKMLDLKLKDKIPCAEIRKRTKIIDIIEYTLKQKWKWAGHIARVKDNRWTRRCTEWQPRRGKRSRGRPSRRWQDDITEKEGTTWIRKATDRRRWKTLMEGYILQWMDKA